MIDNCYGLWIENTGESDPHHTDFLKVMNRNPIEASECIWPFFPTALVAS